MKIRIPITKIRLAKSKIRSFPVRTSLVWYLQASNNHKGVKPEERGVESSGCQVNDLLLGRGQSQTVPEGQNGEGDAAQTSQNKEDVVDLVKWSGNFQFFGVGQESAAVEDSLDDILEDQEAESQSGVWELKKIKQKKLL